MQYGQNPQNASMQYGFADQQYNVVTKIIVLDDKNLERYRLKENGKLILI